MLSSRNRKCCNICSSNTNTQTCECGITVCAAHVSQHLQYSTCNFCQHRKCNLQMFNSKQCIDCYNSNPSSFYKINKMCDCDKRSTKMCDCDKRSTKMCDCDKRSTKMCDCDKRSTKMCDCDKRSTSIYNKYKK
jgi:hypothetical protein